jgi:hypothetical protein
VLLAETTGETADIGCLRRLEQTLPNARLVDRSETAGALAELAAELDRRRESPALDGPSVYACFYDLARLPELRQAEDDFGFGGPADQRRTTPAQQLGRLLSEGPGCGLHVMLWCDSCNTVHRALGRQALQDFGLRVVLQMSEADSAALIDSPAGGRLGPYRALFHHAEQGTLEKFRPYMPPAPSWLRSVGQSLRQHAADRAGKGPPA